MSGCIQVKGVDEVLLAAGNEEVHFERSIPGVLRQVANPVATIAEPNHHLGGFHFSRDVHRWCWWLRGSQRLFGLQW